VIGLRALDAQHSMGRCLARIAVASVAVAALGVAGVATTLAQDNTGVYPGGMTVTRESPSATESTGGELAVPSVSDVANEAATPADVVAAQEPAVPTAADIISSEGVPTATDIITSTEVPVRAIDLSTVFGENFPFPAEENAELGGNINVGGGQGGTITVGGEAGGIAIGGGGNGMGGVYGG
jgi:hypothetical protein